ncbi:hypothetical protein [Thalassobius sp. Cn5-15]|uniref:hypothetical protein n=1 Tax=Thalassobius sp. Cn5-15 TaxID=2917763 RepID=UPI001EF1B365|nr:hypothetical protein [Thalassobius sp. Cn5-15]MCG7491923.1 hypothetical protein [Thalassobius sp. Cn5-15]
MFLELIATFVAGLAAAGGMLLLNKILRGRLPRWLTPVMAGLVMIITTISSEYSWYDRTVSTLPEGLVVAKKVENRAFYRPWTYPFPYVSRFMAVDTQSVRTHAAFEGQNMVDLAFFGRWQPVQLRPVLVDCTHARQAALGADAAFSEAGEIENVTWVDLDRGEGLYQIVCEGKR